MVNLGSKLADSLDKLLEKPSSLELDSIEVLLDDCMLFLLCAKRSSTSSSADGSGAKFVSTYELDPQAGRYGIVATLTEMIGPNWYNQENQTKQFTEELELKEAERYTLHASRNVERLLDGNPHAGAYLGHPKWKEITVTYYLKKDGVKVSELAQTAIK